MQEETFLLSRSDRVIVRNDPDKTFTFVSETKFDFVSGDVRSLARFLKAVYIDETFPHTLLSESHNYWFKYDPQNGLLRFAIQERKLGQSIVMGETTIHQLLNVLNGNTERLVRLVKEDGVI
jgi:hypothetical protein